MELRHDLVKVAPIRRGYIDTRLSRDVQYGGIENDINFVFAGMARFWICHEQRVDRVHVGSPLRS
jgi:hypothetical protein